MFGAYVLVTTAAPAANTYAATNDFICPQWLLANLTKLGVPESWSRRNLHTPARTRLLFQSSRCFSTAGHGFTAAGSACRRASSVSAGGQIGNRARK
jgi:hypothetical protein